MTELDLDAIRGRHKLGTAHCDVMAVDHGDDFGEHDDRCDAIKLCDEVRDLRQEVEHQTDRAESYKTSANQYARRVAEGGIEITRLREAALDVIQRIEAWEAAVRTIISGREVEHGMDLTQLRAALNPEAAAEPSEEVVLYCNKCGWTGLRPSTTSTLHSGCDYYAVVVEKIVVKGDSTPPELPPQESVGSKGPITEAAAEESEDG